MNLGRTTFIANTLLWIFIPGHLLPLGAVLIEELFRPKKKKKNLVFLSRVVFSSRFSVSPPECEC